MGLRRLAISNPSANTDTTIFTADNQYLMSVIATNLSASADYVSVWVEPSGSSASADYAYIVYQLPVDGKNSYETFRFAVNQNDVIKIRATSNNFSFQSYGLVQFDVNLGVGISSFQSASPTNVVDGLIWVDSDGVLSGTSAKPAYAWSSASSSWIPFAGSVDTSGNYTWTGTNTFTGTVTVPGYEKSIPLQSSAPSSPAASDLWVDNTIPSKPILKVYDGSSWIVAGSSIEVDDDQLILATRMFA